MTAAASIATAELMAKLAGRRVIASVSGGKDSAALSLHLRELGIEHERVFMDTGWEHEKTYEYLRGELTRVIGPITWIEPPLRMAQLVVNKHAFPRRTIRFCTQELKVFPLQGYLAGRGDDIVNAIGIRAEESQARSRMPEWDWSDGFNCEVWRPLIAWTEADVIAIHKRHGLAPNPLYLAGASRVGCWPCIYARKSEIRMVADTDPARIDTIRALEQTLTDQRAAARAKRGDLAVSERLTFFQARDTMAAMDIDSVVAWSRTSRGGRQSEMFAPGSADDGCMRWGMCDTPATEGE